MVKYLNICLLFCATALFSGCDTTRYNTVVLKDNKIAAEIMPPQKEIIRTTKGANALDLEAPLRCYVNWQTQQMITTIPYNIKAFNMVQNGKNDMMPRYEVTGFSFETMPAEKALYKLVKEAGIRLVARDAPYASISAENLRGELSEVVAMIADAAEIYYFYDDATKTLRIQRKANFSLYVPKSRPILLGFLDVLRGAGITDITTDWDDYSISFDADAELKEKISKLVSYFEENPTLITYDVSVFRIYPGSPDKEINWQNLLNFFDYGTIRTAKTGVIGRVITTSDELNISRLSAYLSQQAGVEQIAEGKFVVPNLWMSRFDIGKCGDLSKPSSDLSLMAKASLEQENKIFSNITLETTGGEITQFNVRSKFGDNIVIFGLPNEIFGLKSPKSETMIFMVPRIIRTTKTTKHLENNLLR